MGLQHAEFVRAVNAVEWVVSAVVEISSSMSCDVEVAVAIAGGGREVQRA